METNRIRTEEWDRDKSLTETETDRNGTVGMEVHPDPEHRIRGETTEE